jgi:predicted DNA-binding transcriptional regulator AlpA
MQPYTSADRRVAQKAATAATLANLPTDLGRNRVLNAAAAAALWGVSLPSWRRLYRSGAVPKPIQISERRIGWRIGTLADALAERERA